MRLTSNPQLKYGGSKAQQNASVTNSAACRRFWGLKPLLIHIQLLTQPQRGALAVDLPAQVCLCSFPGCQHHWVLVYFDLFDGLETSKLSDNFVKVSFTAFSQLIGV